MFAITMVLVIINVFSRYFFNAPIAWVEEVATSCFVYTVFVGAAWCLRTRQHVGVDLLVASKVKTMPILKISVNYLYFSLLLGFGLMTIYSLWHCWEDIRDLIRGGRKEVEE